MVRFLVLLRARPRSTLFPYTTLFRSEPELAHRAGREVFDDDVRPLDQRIEDLAALGLLHVEREAALGRIEVSKPGLVIETARARAADLHVETRQARTAARFDLDDIRAEIAEHFRRDRSDERPREVEDAHAGQRAGACARRSVSARRFDRGAGVDLHEARGQAQGS